MFCSNCGTPRAGNFCSNCGVKFAASPDQSAASLGQLDSSDKGLLDELTTDGSFVSSWEQELRYKVLLRYPEVRDLIARSKAHTRQGLSADNFLKLCDVAYNPLVGVSLTTVAKIALPISRKLGFRTGKSRTETISQPTGQILVATVCSLAKRNQTLKQVHQADNGCVFEAALPSDLWAMAGDLVVTVQQVDGQCQITAVTEIHGQMFDWGKSTRALNHLFEDLRTPLN